MLEKKSLSLVQFSRSIMSDSLWPHGLQHQNFVSIINSWSSLELMSIELVMPSNHLIFSRPLLLLPSIFPSIRVFSNESVLHIMWPNIEASASAAVLSMNIQHWSPLGLTGLISLQPKGFSRVFSKTAVLQHSVFFMVQLSYPFMTTGKPYLWLYGSLSANYVLFFNTLSRFVIGFLPRSKGLLILRLKSPSAVIMKPKKIKSLCFHVFPSICHEVMEQDAMILVFECWVLSPLFHSPLLPSSRSSLGPLCFLP